MIHTLYRVTVNNLDSENEENVNITVLGIYTSFDKINLGKLMNKIKDLCYNELSEGELEVYLDNFWEDNFTPEDENEEETLAKQLENLINKNTKNIEDFAAFLKHIDFNSRYNISSRKLDDDDKDDKDDNDKEDEDEIIEITETVSLNLGECMVFYNIQEFVEFIVNK